MEGLAEYRQYGGVDRNKTKQIEDIGRVLRREIVDPAKEWRMPHFNGDEQNFIEREEDWDLDRDRQTACERVDLLPLVELHQFLLLPGLVVGETFAQRGHLRLHRLHFRHRGVGFVRQREEGGLDQHRHDQDRETEIPDQTVEIVDRDEQRLGNEIEPTPVDQKIEAVELELLVGVVDDGDFLGAGEQSRIHRSRCAGGNRLGVKQIIRLIGLNAAKRTGRETRLQACARFRQERGRPIFVSDAEPTVRYVEIDDLFLDDVFIGVFLQAGITEHTDQSFMQDVVSGGLRRAVARNQGVGK